MGFAEDVATWSEETKSRLELAVRKIALDVFSEVIMMSPVDTGRFRANWQVAIGNAPDGTLDLYDRPGTATISKVQAEVLGLEVGERIFLINNLDYAEALEFGHSKQAPGGMIRLAVQRYRPIVAAVARELSKG